jgi:cytidine deaminase
MARTRTAATTMQRLRTADRALCEAALAARAHAYAPYSRFAVGAALRTAEGRVFVGCNVENASYGLTICAERNALAAAVAAGARDFTCVAIATEVRQPASPCGACRQVLAELAPALQVLLVNPAGRVVRHRLSSLLPERFEPSQLQGRR